MVWGMSLPSGFGEFFLDGNFEGEVGSPERPGWRDRLNQYYYNELTTEEQKALFDGDDGVTYASYVSGKFVSEVGSKGGSGYPPFNAIAAHEPPRSFILERGGKTIGSLFTPGNRILVVEDALKAIIERLEPGVHQFFPIEIRRCNGDAYPKSYYILVIGQYFNSFLPERSSPSSFRQDGTRGFFHKEKKIEMNGLTFSKAVFGNAHLWRDRRMSREWLTCFSDELIAEVTEAGLRIPKHYRMMEV